MNKKGFCWKRTVSVLMAMAMLITAAPQTGMSVYATGGGNADDLLSVEGITTQGAVGDENDGDVGGDETATNPGNTDESENVGGDTGGTENPEVPGDPENPNLSGDAGQPDNGDEAGDSEDEAEPEESGDELTEDEESMSMNDIGAGVMSADEPMAALETDDETPWYENEELFESIIGREGSSQEGDKRLIIQVAWAKENHVSIADIREYYQTNGDEKFNCVQLQNEVDDKYSSSEVTLDAFDFNTACELLDTGSENYWIDYNFYFPKDEIGVGYTLSKPVEMSGDLKVSYSVALRENQGIIVNLSKTTGYPVADDGGIYINWNKNGDDIYKYLQNDDDAQTRVFAWNGSKPTGMVDLYENINYNNDNGNAYFGLPGGAFMPYDENDNRVLFKANQYYLITSLYVDENSAPMEGTTELTAGQRAGVDSSSVSSASWTVLSADKIKIAPQNGAKVQLSGLNPGDAYYWVSYRAGGKDYGELHMVRAAYVNAKGDHEYTYIGEISKDDDKSTRLRIDENEAFNNNTTVQEILDYYGLDENNEWNPAQRFNVVQLDMQEPESSISGNAMTVKIKGEVFRPACGLLAYESNNWRIDYNFNYVDGEGYYTGKHIGYTLNSPNGDAVADDGEFAVTCTMQPLENQGVVIRLNRVDFPVNENRNGGGVFLNWGRDGFDVNEYFDTSKKAHVVAWDGSKPTEVLNISTDNFYDGGFGLSVGDAFGPRYDEDDQVLFGANQDYLVTTLYADEKAISLGSERDLEVGLRAGGDASSTSGVEWTVLNTDLISIVPAAEAGGVATLKANEEDKTGEAYYWVNYQVEGKDYSELHSVIVAAVGTNGKELVYLGEERSESFDDDGEEIHFKRLVIDETEAKEKNNGASITDILDYRRERGDVFNCVQFEVIDSSPKTRTMNKDYINKARAIMADIDKYHECWMDYNFRSSDSDGRETRVEFTMTTLTGDAKKNVPASFTLTELANQGLKVKFTSTADFPAERVEMRYNVPAMYDKSIPIEDGQLRLFTHSSGTPTAMVSTAQEQGWGYYNTNGDGEDPWSNFYFNNIKPLGNKEYLAASIYEDVRYEESGMIGTKPVVGVATQMKAGTRAGGEEDTVLTSVTWKTFDTDKATIDKNGNMTAWSKQGPIYYYVKYKSGSNTYLEVHETWAAEQPVAITLDQEKLTLNYRADGNSEEEWLKVRYYPVGVDRNESRIKWEIEGGSNNVISFVPDQDGVIRGGIRAEGPGTATVKVSYLAGDYNDEGKFVPEGGTLATATCEVTVAQQYTWEEKANEPINGKSIEGLYAILGIDETLAAIELPYDDDTDTGWTWDEPNTSLASFKGSYGHPFAATYTFNGVKQFSGHVWVAFVTPMGITLTMKNMNEERQDDEPEWYEGVPSSMWAGDALNEESGEYDNADQVTLSYQYVLDGAGIWDDDGGARYRDAIRRLEEYEQANYTVEWTSTPKDALEEVETGKIYRYTASIVGKTRKAEKKTFTVTVKNAKNKAVYKASANVTVTVSPNYDFDGAAFENEDHLYVTKDSSNQMWLVVKVNNTTVEDYSKNKLTIASEDTAVLKLTANKTVINSIKSVENSGKGTEEEQEQTEDNTVYVKIPCTNPKPGTAWIKITAPDEMKNFRRYQIDFPDKEPKAVSATTVAINRAMTEENRTATVTVRTNAKYPLEFTAGEEGSNIDYLLNNKASESLVIRGEQTGNVEIYNDQYNIYDITVSLPDKDDSGIKNGKSTVTLNLKVKPTEDGESDELTYQLKLTVNVSNTVPKVTFKQTKKVNLFYTDNEGDGTLTFTVAGGAEFDGDPWLEDYVDVKKPANDAECNFVLLPRDDADNQYDVSLKYENSDGPDYVHKDPKKNKGILKYRLKGYDGEFQANLTVSTETKKPTIVLSAKSDTLYPKVYYTNSFIQMTDKATGEDIFKIDEGGNQARYVVNAKKGEYIDLNVAEVDWDHYDDHTGEEQVDLNNSYHLIVTPWGQITSRLVEQEDLKSYKTKADKITLEVKKANWADYISVPYSLTVSTSDPKLVLGKSTLTLNKNINVYQSQQERTTLRLKGHTNQIQWDEWNSVTFVGQDDKSKKVLSTDGSLVLDYWSNPGDVLVSFNDNNLATGTYKFKINVGTADRDTAYASTTLTVKVVDTPVSKNLKVTAKGSIDLMNIDGTSVTYTPKLSNLSGQVNGGWLEGKDADMFENWWDGSKLVVQARWGNSYSTKVNYQVYPVFSVGVQDYNGYTVRPDKALNIKVKQGKPKLTAAMSSNTIYRQLDNDVEIKLSAILGKKDVEIENVWLANYWGDFELQPNGTWHNDDTGEDYPLIYNPEAQSVRLKLKDRYNTDNVSVVQSGKTWKVKLQVQYANKAENEKVAEVTCSIVVR